MRRVSSFLWRVLVLGVLLHAYVGARLLPDLAWPALRWTLGLWLVASCLLIPAGMLARRNEALRHADTIAWVGLLAMGFFSSLLVLCVIRDVVLVLVELAHLFVPGIKLTAGGLARTALAVPLAALAVCAIGFLNARRRARVVHVEVPIAHLPAALDGFTIAQISDVHVGPTIKHGYVEAIVKAVNALDADMIAITGDVVDGSVDKLAPHAAPLANLHAHQGVYLVTGNHEYYSGAEAWIAQFRRMGLTVLLNQHRVITQGGEHLVVAGVTDYSAGQFDPAQASDPQAALQGAPDDARVRVLLAHQPRSAMAAAAAGYTLQLSGHTHGGQFLPWNFFVRFQQPFTSGLARLGDLWVYTSRGTGYWGPPKRFGAPSEITCLRLVRATV